MSSESTMIVRTPWKNAAQGLRELLQEAGLHLVQSFNLQDARKSLLESTSCTCPHHGTVRCSCQYVVYLIYDETAEPVTLVVHGYDDFTEISFEDTVASNTRDLRTKIVQMLKAASVIA